jgi:hypothetical protein
MRTFRLFRRAAFAVCIVALPCRAAPAPRLMCDEPVRVFTAAEAAAGFVRHTFVLRNAGTAAVDILGVDLRCGCSDMDLSHRLLPGGTQATLAVTLNLRGREGAVDQALWVRSSDPATPRLKLSFTGRVAPEAEFRPLAALFGLLPEQGSVTQSVEVVFAPHRPTRIVRATTDHSGFGVSTERIEEGRRYAVQVWNLPGAELGTGYVRAQVRIETDPPLAAPLTLPVTGLVLDELIVAPSAIQLTKGDPGPHTRFAAVRPGRVRTFRVTEVRTPDPSIRAEILPLGDGWQIRLTGLTAEARFDGAELIVLTDVPTCPELRIPFRISP